MLCARFDKAITRPPETIPNGRCDWRWPHGTQGPQGPMGPSGLIFLSMYGIFTAERPKTRTRWCCGLTAAE